MPGGFDTVLVVDFGAQYAQLIARRVRECHVYSEIVPSTMPAQDMLARHPKAIILSGGPSSVYADGAPPAPPGLLNAGIPILGICYGFQLLVAGLGGTVERTGLAEYGATTLESASAGRLLSGTPATQQVWMSHGDTCTAGPARVPVTARTQATPVAAVENPDRGLFGVQFHPEVVHTEYGTRVLARFLELAGCRPSWTMLNIVEDQVAAIREQVGGSRAICGLSGGVDSAVAAALVQRAIGDRLTCVFVDHGLLRKGEAEQVEQDFVAATGVRLKVATEADVFLTALAGVTDPEQKRKVIGREFIRAFERAAREITAEAGEHGEACEFLVQGTLYPDVVESGGGTGTANIKSHHNVGGLPDDLKFRLVEPLRALFKDEVRRVGERARPAPGHRPPPAVPRPRPGHQDRRRGDRGPARGPARGRRHRPRGDVGRRAGRPGLAVPGRAAGRRAFGGRARGRPQLRPSARAPPGDQRGRHDRGLGPAARRRAGPDLHPGHQRGPRGQPRRPRRHQQASRHHRVGVKT